MADDREPYEPLWAESLRREPGPRPAEPAQPEAPRVTTGWVVAMAGLVASAVLLAVIASALSSRVTFADLPSYWGTVDMTCATVRVEEDDRTVELFRCRPDGAGELPSGTYRPPGTNWNSDFDRRPAEDYVIRISPSGDAVGWALYRP